MTNMIRKIGLFVLLIVLIDPVSVFAQNSKIELTPTIGYQFGGKMRFYEGDLKMENNMNYGLTMNIDVAPETKLELMWIQMATTAEFMPFYGYDDLATGPVNVNVNYIQIGGVREIGDDMIRPFGAFTLGTTYFSPQESGYSEDWQFSITLGGGAKIWITEKIGIRLQGRLLMPLYFQGASLYFGTGGSGAGVGAGSTILQGDFTAGLMIGLGN